MTGFWDVILSPAGLAAYAAFWALKLAFGAWIIRQTLGFLPVAMQDRVRRMKQKVLLRR